MAFAFGRQSTTSSGAVGPMRVNTLASRMKLSMASSCAHLLPCTPTFGWLQRHRVVFAPGCIHVSTGTRLFERKPPTEAIKASCARAGNTSRGGYVGQKAKSRFTSDTRNRGSPVAGCRTRSAPRRSSSPSNVYTSHPGIGAGFAPSFFARFAAALPENAYR